MTIGKLWSELNARMFPVCPDKPGADNSTKEACWVEKLQVPAEHVDKHLVPKAPNEWKKNPITWLTNYDIDGVLKQYEDDVDNHYKYMGTFPIDFSAKKFGQCLYNEMCTIDIRKLVNSGKYVLGAVFNTDVSTGAGQHWISLIAVLNPAYAAYGVYFQDSAGSPPPPSVDQFMKSLKDQADKLNPGHTFKIDNHNRRMQFKNTECGVFSIVYQIRWINILKSGFKRKSKQTGNIEVVLPGNMVQFKHVSAKIVSDDEVKMARNMLFRS